MKQPSLRTTTAIFLGSILTLGTVACSQDSEPASTAEVSPAEAAAVVEASPSPSLSPSPQEDSFQEAFDMATGATAMGKSALAREDWVLIVQRWEKVIKLLETVPASSPNHKIAQEKLAEYKSYLAKAKQRATPRPDVGETISDANPKFFSIPIKAKSQGIPIVAVTFNGSKTFDMLFDTGATNTLITQSIAQALELRAISSSNIIIANGSIVSMPVMQLESMATDGRVKTNVRVAMAESMPIGLLGQDFYAGYDINIKTGVIEFTRR
ncbi:MAG: retropepsin-like aspartic protease [Spirulinaceae cyanobacterium]